MKPTTINGWAIPDTYASRKALRDHLTVLVDVPGADHAPIMSGASSGRKVFARHGSRLISLEINDAFRADLDIALTPDDARRLAARLVFLADNPGAA